ncbi:MAG: EmrB/QacA subfamily drug resistance transporter [Verrucomicrobiales bacterium]|jgi:EmrB/QacA subfamily drug resistance transporter
MTRSFEMTRRQASPTAILWAVGFAVFVAADDLTVVTTMLRPIINDLGLTLPDGLDDAAWIVNVYLIAFVSVMPLAGRLSDVIGRRMLFVLAYLVFLVGTIVIPLSSSMAPFLIGRVLTAIGGGAMVPVALAVVGDVFTDAKRARALGGLGAIETMGWVWGPLYGALLVRFLDWRWQFWLNIPLAIVGMALAWWALAGVDERPREGRVDWTGAVLLALTLVALDLALLGNAEIQSVSGLEELQGGSGFDFRLLFPVAIVLGGLFVWHERRSPDPLIDPSFFRSRNLRIALIINLLVGAALIIAMVDVPIFVNAIEVNLERSAVLAGWILAALTAAMALASWVGGRLAERYAYRTPTVIGMAAASIALLVMGLTWDPDISYAFGAAQLALLGAGLGLVFAPTTATVVDASPPSQRGAAAAIVMIVRLVGLSVGLAALTAWGLGRFNELRQNLELPSITDPGFQEAITEASARLTADAVSETFLAASAVCAVGVIIALFARSTQEAPMAPKENDDTAPTWIPAALAVLAIGLIGALIGLAIVFSSLNDTKDELAFTNAELIRVEEGAAGSAIVSAQVLEIARQISELEPQISEGLDTAIVELENFSNSSIEFNVAVDETVVIDTEITIDRDFSFPIDEIITIDEIIAIDQTVDTTIEIDTGLGFKVPVNVTVPVNVDVPVQVDVPIKLDVDVPINETVPVRAEVPINLNVPIEVNIAETDLKVLADQLAEGLRQVQAVVGDLVG